jgi:DNA-binding transcriptional MerR regulator
MPTDAPYSIGDLARLTGLSVRTIRYYLAQGLIPASGESGPGAHYGEGHLGRLRLVRRLQQQHLPLAEIRSRLAALTDPEVTVLAADGEPPVPAPPQSSALDYVRAILAGPNPARPPAQVWAAPAPAAPGTPAARSVAAPMARASMAARVMFDEATPGAPLVHNVAEPPAAMAATPTVEPSPPSIERSQWERLSLGPNLELHIRRPLGRLEQKRVERLITIARQVLKEEQP